MPAMQNWQNFYMLTGAASATLIGLLFVAVSLGAEMTMKQATTSIRTFVNPTLIYYAQVLFISCLAVMPVQSPPIVDGVLLVLGGINIFLALKVWWRILVLHRDQNPDAGHWFWHCVLPLIAGILFVCAAIGFMLDAQLSMLGVAVTDLLFLAIGLHNTWELTLWLVLHRKKSEASDHEQRANISDAALL